MGLHYPAGDQVWVKVVSKTGQRLGLSMRDVDQLTGQDLLPMGRGGGGDLRSNPSGPSGANAVSMTALHGLSGIKVRPGVLECFRFPEMGRA